MADDPNLAPKIEPVAPVAPVVEPAAPAPSIALADLTTAGIPEAFIKDGVLDAKALAASITEGATLKAAAEERAKGVPADGKYDFALPADFKLPDELKASPEFLKSWNVSEAKAKQFAAYAKEAGYSQDEVTNFVKNWALADASDKLSHSQELSAAYTAEMGKLGANARGRLESIDGFLKANIGDQFAVALTRELSTAAAIEAVEALINKANGSKLATHKGGNGQINNEASDLIGKPGAGRKLLDLANSKASN